jgi:hypothetical protein
LRIRREQLIELLEVRLEMPPRYDHGTLRSIIDSGNQDRCGDPEAEPQSRRSESQVPFVPCDPETLERASEDARLEIKEEPAYVVGVDPRARNESGSEDETQKPGSPKHPSHPENSLAICTPRVAALDPEEPAKE